MSDPLIAAVAALWGAAAGTLVPRAAYRFSVEPEEEWRDACPNGHPITGHPITGHPITGRPMTGRPMTGRPVEGIGGGIGRGWLGWARCGACGQSYGPGTVPVAVATALVCALLALATGPRPELAVWLLLAPVGVLLAVVDFRVQRLPDALTLPLAGAAPALLGVVAFVPEHLGEWLTALLGALALGAAYFVLFLINPSGMGFGDVKLALGLGAVLGWYGWGTVVLGTFAGFLFGGLYGLGLVVVRKAGRKTSIPFGPFLIAGAYVGLLMGAYAA